MIISVLGNIIDTEDIYLIEPLYINKDGFNILFFNQKKLPICRCVSDLFPSMNEYFDEMRKHNENNIKLKWLAEQDKKVENQVKTLRDTLIAYWSNNQSSIPKLEFV